MLYANAGGETGHPAASRWRVRAGPVLPGQRDAARRVRAARFEHVTYARGLRPDGRTNRRDLAAMQTARPRRRRRRVLRRRRVGLLARSHERRVPRRHRPRPAGRAARRSSRASSRSTSRSSSWCSAAACTRCRGSPSTGPRARVRVVSRRARRRRPRRRAVRRRRRERAPPDQRSRATSARSRSTTTTAPAAGAARCSATTSTRRRRRSTRSATACRYTTFDYAAARSRRRDDRRGVHGVGRRDATQANAPAPRSCSATCGTRSRAWLGPRKQLAGFARIDLEPGAPRRGRVHDRPHATRLLRRGHAARHRAGRRAHDGRTVVGVGTLEGAEREIAPNDRRPSTVVVRD